MPHRVLITRAARQSSELADRLTARGVEPVLLPAIEIVPPTSLAPLEQALQNLGSFDWLLFTSANAVESLEARLDGQPLRFAGRTAVIGPATARSLEVLGLSVNLQPAQAVAEAFTQALLPHALRPGGEPARFLLLRAEEAREHLPESLVAAGAEVTVAPVYRTVIPERSVELLRSLLSAGGAAERRPGLDAISFTSSSTVRNLLALCTAAGVQLPASALRISIGPITSRTLREAGMPPHAEAPEATVLSLAETIAAALATSGHSDPDEI